MCKAPVSPDSWLDQNMEESCFHPQRANLPSAPQHLPGQCFSLADDSFEKSTEEEPLQLNRGVVRDFFISKRHFLLLAQPPEHLTECPCTLSSAKRTALGHSDPCTAEPQTPDLQVNRAMGLTLAGRYQPR